MINFEASITLTKDEALDVLSTLEDARPIAETAGEFVVAAQIENAVRLITERLAR